MGTTLLLAAWNGSQSMQSCMGQVGLCGLKREHHRLTLKLRWASAKPTRPVHVIAQMRGGCLRGVPKLLLKIWEWSHTLYKRRVKLKIVRRCS